MAQDKYLEDISADELSAEAPADETDANRDARRERNKRRNKRRRRLRDNLPIRNLTEALEAVESRVHTTRSNASCRSQRSHAKFMGYVLEKSSPSLQKTPTSCESTTGSPSHPPPGTVTMKLQVAAQTSATTVLKPSCRLIPTALVQTPADPLKAAIALQLLAAIVISSLTATLAAAAATAEAPTMRPTGGTVAKAVAVVETTRTATPL
jgi:hypothetical protein